MIKGKAIKYGDNINTDEIIPAKYLYSRDPDELARHCFEGLDLKFAGKVKKGDILVVGKNFGCGSSREHAPVAIKSSGISCIIAKSFARIFFRNAINIGLPIIESGEASGKIQPEDEIEIDIAEGRIKNITKSENYDTAPFPEFMQEIIDTGGLINRIKNFKKK
jgi:3-isopropylmalate/(R)-2-methylmalate dehydratase small subunit